MDRYDYESPPQGPHTSNYSQGMGCSLSLVIVWAFLGGILLLGLMYLTR